MRTLLEHAVTSDQDVVAARRRAAQIAGLLAFDPSEQTRIATAVSEIVRNAFRYAQGGTVTFGMDADSRPQRLVVRVDDHGPGIEALDRVLAGQYRSTTGLGMGIVGAQRLMDRFSIETSSSGTSVTLEKLVPARSQLFTEAGVDAVARSLRERGPQSLVEEVQQQNQELLRALEELRQKQQELAHLNRELEDTNRGVVALYAELDEKADHLRRADELKSRFLSNMTHEFRTPVNSIIGLTNLIVDERRREGREPEPEVTFIRKAAEQLMELVEDLLDLAKVEAGKTVVRPALFEVNKLFGALRGMLRPLLLNQSVALVFEDAGDLPPMQTDEGKVSQILRNLISNALKFTERGEVRVSARLEDDGDAITIAVADTGIGIAAADQPRIFEEFAQIEHPLQRRVRGTGLGLPLSRRLAELLGGTLSVASEPGAGSTFSVTLPVRYPGAQLQEAPPQWTPEPGKLPLLVVDEAADSQYIFQKILKPSPFQPYPARGPDEMYAALGTIAPAAIVLDIVFGTQPAWDVLARLKQDEATRGIPVVVVSALQERERGLALGAEAYLTKPVDRRVLLDTLGGLHARSQPHLRVLTIDDEDVARYLVRQCLAAPAFDVLEAESGEQGLAIAQAARPDVILLDLVMPGMKGQQVLDELSAHDTTRTIPVIILTSSALDRDEHARLLRRAAMVMAKSQLSREALAAAIRGALGDRAIENPV